MNDALTRLDAAAQLTVSSSDLTDPPAVNADGAAYLIPGGASGAWQGRQGRIAVWSNGGWIFLAPRAGWRAWDEGRNRTQFFDGVDWVPDAIAVSSLGAATLMVVSEFDHAITPGASNDAAVQIPPNGQVLGVTGRVVADVTGPGLTGWRIGVAGAENRYGTGLGLGANAYLIGMSGSPVTYYSATSLRLTAEGGAFGAGTIRLAIHYLRIRPPRAV